MVDVLHALDQGVLSHLIANVFFEVMSALGPNQEAQVKALDVKLNAWYKAHPSVYKIDGHLTVNRIKTSSDWPKLKVKAAASRAVLDFAFDLATEYNSGSLHDQQRVAVCQLMRRFYEIIKSEPLFMSVAARAEIKRIANLFLGIYKQLAGEALGREVKAWKMVPKFHEFEHLCELQTFLNPRSFWTYSDEDLQRILKEVGLSCHPSTVAFMATYKWICFTYGDFDIEID